MVSFNEYTEAIGARVHSKRAESGMGLRTFGNLVGIHHNQLLLIEQGKTNPSLKTLYKIAEGLDTDLVDLLS